MKLKFAVLSLALMMPFAASAADGYNSAGTWSVGAGVSRLDPKTNNGITTSSSTRVSATGEYFVMDNLGVELFVAAPFETDIGVSGFAGRLASSKMTTPILSAKYHFNSDGRVSPYLGLGVGYSDYHDTKADATGPIAGAALHLNDTWGAAANAGLDFKLNANSAIRADVRWMDSSPRLTVNGFDAGRQKADPLIYGVSYVHQF